MGGMFVADVKFESKIETIKEKFVPKNADRTSYSLLIGFFEFYSTFDFRKDAICISMDSHFLNRVGTQGYDEQVSLKLSNHEFFRKSIIS